MVRLTSQTTPLVPHGGGYLTKFYIHVHIHTRRLHPKAQPLTFLYTILEEGTPFIYLLLRKGTPFTYLLKNTAPLSNEVNEEYYRRISSITRRNVKQTTSVIYSVHSPFKYLNDPFTYPFIYLKPEKGTPFGQSLPI